MSVDSKQILLVAEVLSNEKGLEKDVVFKAIQAAIEAATKRGVSLDIGVNVVLDQKTGEFETFRYWDVVDEEALENPDRELTLSEAQERDPSVAIGGRVVEKIESVGFGRIGAQFAKQVIFQKVREAERELVIAEYEGRIGELINGVVKKTTRDNVIVDLGGKAEALLPRSEMLPNEVFRPGDKVRAYLQGVECQSRGPQLRVSRTCPEMLIELFRIEVPEIGEEVIIVKAAARDPGNRAKIAVKTNDGRIDPIGACVGMRGSRVQAVSSELAGERVDIVLWDDNPAQLVINALAPAEISSIVVDEEKHAMDISVSSEKLSMAIGRNGQNVRLASQLTGWVLNVMSEEAFNEKSEQESERTLTLFTEQLEVDEDIANALIDAGFSTLEEVAYVAKEEMLEVEGFDDAIVDELSSRANNILLAKALSSAASEGTAKPAEDLLAMEGMDDALATELASRGIVTMEDLAEQSVDDLLEIVEDLDEKRAGNLIMTARKPWFE